LDLTEQQFTKMFAARKIAEHAIINSKFQKATGLFLKFSTTTITYKGLMPQKISAGITPIYSMTTW
jgi:glutamate synthase (ferredoxin)